MDPIGRGESGDGDRNRRGTGRGRGRGSWTPFLTPEHQTLRRPHQLVNQSIGIADSERIKIDGSINNQIVQFSNLSVDAAEFVPRTYPPPQPITQTHTVQNRLMNARRSQNQQLGQPQLQQQQAMQQQYSGPHQQQQYHQKRFMQHQQCVQVPQQHRYDQYSNIPDYGHYEGGSGDYGDSHQRRSEKGDIDHHTCFSSIVQDLKNRMKKLILNPGYFDSLITPLIDTIGPYLEQASHSQELITVVLQQSINEGNFRYSGARLCTSLDNIMIPQDRTSSTFRDILLTRCREETELQTLAWQQKSKRSEEEEKRCHGLILFLAELVTQMESSPASVLGKLLVELIFIVLKQPAANSAKYICQALKLAGQTLERDNGGNRKEMEQVMRALSDLVTQGLVDSHVGHMVHSVRELHHGNWGRGTPAYGPGDSSQPTTVHRESDEPVFYGPDGNILSAEESRFLQDLTEDTADTEEEVGSEESSSVQCSEGEQEDNDIAEAYEEFLKLPQNNSNTGPRQ